MTIQQIESEKRVKTRQEVMAECDGKPWGEVEEALAEAGFDPWDEDDDE